MRALILLMIAAAVLLLGAAGLSRAVYGRSLRSTLYEMRQRRQHAHPRTARAEEKRLDRLKGEPEPVYALPDSLGLDFEVVRDVHGSLPVFTLNPGGGEVTVLYLHGGAYINNFNAYQWRFMNALAGAAGCEIVAPDYHLAPFGDCERAYTDLTSFHVDWCAEHPGRRLLLMGDSAGGGLALGLAEALAAADEPLPERLILLSPWVDVTMENPDIEPLIQVEPLLHLDLMKVHGRRWAGALDPRDWRVSPLFGALEGLPPVSLFCGTRELLYPDILRLRDALDAAGVDVDCRVGRGLNHDYPLMPIPEARPALDEIAELCRQTQRHRPDCSGRCLLGRYTCE